MRKSIVLLAVVCMTMQAAFAAFELQGVQTYQEWDFNTPERPAPASYQDNEFATEPLLAEVSGSVFGGNLQHSNGIWTDSSLKVTMGIPNNPVLNPYKIIEVEMRYQGQIMESWVADIEGNDFPYSHLDRVIENCQDGWKVVKDVWEIRPNPYAEKLCYGLNGLGQTAALDYIHVHTRCVPEPATLGLISLGLMLVRRRK